MDTNILSLTYIDHQLSFLFEEKESSNTGSKILEKNDKMYMFKFIGTSIDEYYIRGITSKIIEIFQYGIIININNINYICTTYLPNGENCKIFYNDNEIIFTECFKQYLFNINIYKVDNIFNMKHFHIKNCIGNIKPTKNNTNAYIQTSTELIKIPLIKLNYELNDAKHPSLPKIIVLSIKIDDTIGLKSNYINIIHPGNTIYRIFNNKLILLGIVSHLINNDTEIEIIIIPSYTLIQTIKLIKNNKLNNIWNKIEDGKIISNYNNFNYKKIMIGDTITKLNNNDVINGEINIKSLNINVPIQTYIWYNQYENKQSKFFITIERTINICRIDQTNQYISLTVEYPYKDIDTIMPLYFNHNIETFSNKIKHPKEFNEYDVTYQNLSFELIDYLTENDIYIKNNFINIIFNDPFNHKINSVIITNINFMKSNYDFLINIINNKQQTSFNIDLLQMSYVNKKYNYDTLTKLNSIYNKFKNKSNTYNINLNIINDNKKIFENMNIIF